MKKLLVILLSCLCLVSCAGENKSLTWGMSESQVRKAKNISDDIKTFSIDDYSWIICENQNIFDVDGSITYNFDNAELAEVGFSVTQIANGEEMDNIYSTLKENIILIYGNPAIDFQEDEETQYRYAQWNVGNTTAIRLQDDKDEMYVSLDCTSIVILGALEPPETTSVTTTAAPVQVTSSKYKTKGEWALSTPYAFAVENDTYSGDVYCAGEYTFKVTNTTLGEAPMYDIYIEKSEYDSVSELGEIDYTVGGSGSFPISIILNKGDYVYVVPYSDLLYEPKGYLTFEIKD